MSEKRIHNNKKRRQHQLQRNLSLGIITCTLVLLCAVVFGGSIVRANSEKNPSFKYFTTITVRQGDTLWSIANENMSIEYKDIETYMDEVIQMNHLKDETIKTGDYLIVPYYSSEFIS